jgi:SAM-dependent methyltransferase
MYEELVEINRRPKPYETYTAEILWNDRHISKKMLEVHLNEELDLASRNKGFIEKSVEWMVSRFDIGTETRIADFGCGPGLYTTRLAEKGANVTGIDFSERSIRYAKETASQKNLDIDYVLQNYLEFETEKKFDLITLIFCDLCPLSPEQRKKILRMFYKYLDDDGYIFLDVVSLNGFDQREEVTSYEHLQLDGFWSAEDYYAFLNIYKYENEKVVLDKYTIIEEKRTREVYNWLQYYSLDSLKDEFEGNGFRIIERYSDVSGTPFIPDATQMAVVAEKIK